MLTLMLMLIVFVGGFLTAYVDWNSFLKELVYDVRSMENLASFILSFSVILVSYFFFMYIPASFFVETTHSKFSILSAGFDEWIL